MTFTHPPKCSRSLTIIIQGRWYLLGVYYIAWEIIKGKHLLHVKKIKAIFQSMFFILSHHDIFIDAHNILWSCADECSSTVARRSQIPMSWSYL